MSTKIKTKINNNIISEEVIDVPGAKLLEWLTDRKKITAQWKKNQANLLKLINIACETTTTEKKQYNYYDCQRIFKEFESIQGGNSTTLFGGYSNINTQKWYEVIKAYEKDNYHIGESCQLLSQNLNYEIPSLRKTIERSIKTIEEDQKKPFSKNKTTATTAFKKACNDLGIKGDKIRDEIIELPLQLNPLFNQIVELLVSKNISNAIEFYTDVLKKTKIEFGENITEPLPLLSFLIKHGNITMGERERILNPKDDEIIDKQNNNSANNSNSNNEPNLEIDWCITPPVTIVWEDNNDASTIDVNESNIQWDDFSMENIEIVEESSSNTIELVLESSNDNNIEMVVMEEENKNKKQESTITTNLSETILEYRPLRNQFIDELFELEIFLNHRSNEMEKSNSVFGIDQISNESIITVAECKEYYKSTNEILLKLSNQRVKQILEIKSSDKFVDRLVLQFTQKQQNISRCNQLIIENEQKIDELNQLLGESRNKIDQLNKETKLLKSNLESTISFELFNKKKVNIMIPFSL